MSELQAQHCMTL